MSKYIEFQVGQNPRIILELPSGEVFHGTAYVGADQVMFGGSWRAGVSHIVLDEYREDLEVVLESIAAIASEDGVTSGVLSEGEQWELLA